MVLLEKVVLKMKVSISFCHVNVVGELKSCFEATRLKYLSNRNKNYGFGGGFFWFFFLIVAAAWEKHQNCWAFEDPLPVISNPS